MPGRMCGLAENGQPGMKKGAFFAPFLLRLSAQLDAIFSEK
jgi:hypothetical protein